MAEPDTEPWMPNGFPPPSFVVGKQRVSTVVSSRSRWILVAALVGVVLLVAGLLQLAQGGSDRTALKTGASTTFPADVDPGTPDTFPPFTETVPSLTPDASLPPPTLPVVPPRPAVAPSTTARKVTTTAPRPAPVPAPRPRPAPAPTPAPTSPPPTSPPPPPNTPPRVTPVGSTFAQSSPCIDAWDVLAMVVDADGVMGVSAIVSGREVQMAPEPNQPDIWMVRLDRVVNETVQLQILARDASPAVLQTLTEPETYAC